VRGPFRKDITGEIEIFTEHLVMSIATAKSQ
jgi:hypothetical protein